MLMRHTVSILLAAPLSILALGSCASYPGQNSQAGLPPGSPIQAHQVAQTIYVPDLPLSSPPFDQVQASWKQRLDQPYVFIEHVGSYTETGTLIPALHRELAAQGMEASGAPFCLFFDDPALVEAGRLVSRACVPIAGPRSPQSPLAYDILPSTTVAYAFVTGPYPDAPRAYPGIYKYMDHMNWVESGPIREIYLVPPGADKGSQELIAEIQIPASPGGHR